MPQSLTQLYVHLIFSTKHREKTLFHKVYEPFREYLGGILRGAQSPALAIGCMPDHVHILFIQSKNASIADTVEAVKTSSSRWMKSQGAAFQGFHWQTGYGAFSVSASRLEHVRHYVLNQEEHHREIDFKDELRRFLKEYQVEHDERYLWD